MKKTMLGLLLLLCLTLCACSGIVRDPLEKNEATAVPGTQNSYVSAAVGDSNASVVTATLYFRFRNEEMLAGETRQLTVNKDETVEKAIITALLSGPGAGYSDLVRLFSQDVRLVSCQSQDNILFVTLSGDLATMGSGKTAQVLLTRRLAVASLVASITENCVYSGVQVLLEADAAAGQTMRLENSWLDEDGTGVCDPFTRDESLLLTPGNTVKILLECWQQKDWERMYQFVSPSTRPLEEEAAAAMDGGNDLTDCTISGGSVSPAGDTAVVTVGLTVRNDNGVSQQITGYPVLLRRENGVWKMDYNALLTLLSLEGGVG